MSQLKIITVITLLLVLSTVTFLVVTHYTNNKDQDQGSSASGSEDPFVFTPNNTELKDAVNVWVNTKDIAEQRYGHISTWVTSNVTSMNKLFMDLTTFNENLNYWDFSNVTSMDETFYSAKSFNNGGYAVKWNTDSLNSVKSMFYNAQDFNVSLQINTSEITNMYQMFLSAKNFNADIGDWETDKVVNMEKMFIGAISFNRDIGSWNTGSVKNMDYMFQGASKFNKDIGSWDTSNVTSMDSMFKNCDAFNNGQAVMYDHNGLDITGMPENPLLWDTSKVTNMREMFRHALVFSQKINTENEFWNTGSVLDMSYMFEPSYTYFESPEYHTVYVDSRFNEYIGDWDVSKVTNMYHMFWNLNIFRQDLSNWTIDSTVSNNTHLYLFNADNTLSTCSVNKFDIETDTGYTCVDTEVVYIGPDEVNALPQDCHDRYCPLYCGWKKVDDQCVLDEDYWNDVNRECIIPSEEEDENVWYKTGQCNNRCGFCVPPNVMFNENQLYMKYSCGPGLSASTAASACPRTY